VLNEDHLIPSTVTQSKLQPI